MSTRWEIINYLIQKNNYKSFLEIGTYKMWLYDQVKCDYKVAVDPFPCKTLEQEKLPYGSVSGTDTELVIKLTSDEFFESRLGEDKYDICFIDGLHSAPQVLKDISNCLKHLNKGGHILLHDCNPPLEKHTTTGDEHGAWTGDCYRAIIDIQKNGFTDFDFMTLDTDWGIGIIKPHAPIDGVSLPILEMRNIDWNRAKTDWNYFDQNRKEILNLKTVEEFLKINE